MYNPLKNIKLWGHKTSSQEAAPEPPSQQLPPPPRAQEAAPEPPSQIAIHPEVAEVQDTLLKKVHNSYKKRRGFTGDKVKGTLSYTGSHGLDLHALRKRSAKAYTESMQGRAIIKRLKDTVINTGLALESTPESTTLGITQDDRKEVSSKIESRFGLWGRDKKCDKSKNNTLGQIERILFNNQLVKGDYFAALPFSNDPNLLNPLQIKIIKPETVDTPFDAKIKKEIQARGNYIQNGVEFNEDDEEVAIFIKSKKPNSFKIEWTRFPFYGTVSGRQILVHGITQEFGYEHRGVPALAHVAHELEKITDYSLLELMAAIANATIAVTVVPSKDAPATAPMPGNTFVPPDLVKTADGFENSDADFGSAYTNIGETRLINRGGLLVSSLKAGEELKSHDTKRPNVNFNEFVDGITKYLAASLSMPIEILHMTFGKNFSASRASLKMYWQSLLVWRNEFVSDFLTPVYNSWLLGEVGTGNLILRGFDNPHLRAAWQSAKWIGVPSPSIDPVKEERGAQIRNKEGYTTRAQEAQKHGSSYDSNVERLKAENEQLAEANQPLVDQQNTKAA